MKRVSNNPYLPKNVTDAYYCVKINSLSKKKQGFFSNKVLLLKHH